MRIIAGKGRSLPLKTIEGIDTRPTTDRIKETLFNMLQYEIADCRFLDLFAGSGQIGLEAVSRGAKEAVFVESGKKAAACIQDNINFTQFNDQCRLMQMDVMAAIRSLEGKGTFQIIFMDPPYNQELEKDVLMLLSKSTLVDEDTVIIVEASLKTGFEYLEELGFNGHVDMIERASKIVDELVVGVLNNSAKNSLFSLDERVSMLKEITKDMPNVTVASFDGLLVDFMEKIDATIIVRGLRAVTDFEYELQIAQSNHRVNPKIDTVFLTTNVKYSYLSSTIVKEYASYGGDISHFVPPQFIERIYDKYNIKK